MKNSDGRTHLILVPGFGGFDGLGQFEYYAGTTALFEEWRGKAQEDHAVLHYFDNLPTSGVVTRAQQLRKYLAKLIARNIIGARDDIVLIGHSTGGLDIRQLLGDLTGSIRRTSRASGGRDPANDRPGQSNVTYVDGGVETASRLLDEELRKKIRRVVFLSVPQRGTNIADWLREHPRVLAIPLAWVRTGVDAADVPLLEQLDINVFARFSRWLQGQLDPEHKEEHSGWVAAALDVHGEMAARRSPDATRAADARDARADFERWLDNMQGDFLAIRDLSAGMPASKEVELQQTSVARFNDAERKAELHGWAADSKGRWGAIDVCSYATLGRCPFEQDWLSSQVSDQPARTQRLMPHTLKHVLSHDRAEGTSDALYRLTYWLCTKGPFASAYDVPLTDMNGERIRNVVGGSHIQPWHNDGIVNTASMLWPNGADTHLVYADHGDIIGHYAFGLANPDEHGRKYQRYDIFKSANRGQEHFDYPKFSAVWFGIFDFAVHGTKLPTKPVGASSEATLER